MWFRLFVVHQPQRTQRWPRQEFTPNCGKLYREIPLMDAIRLRKKPMMFVYNCESLQNKMHFPLLLAAVVGGEIVDLVGETGPVAKVVLLSLLIFSVISWAIILSKWSLVRRARVQSGRFVRAFRKAQRLQDVSAVAEQFKPSPLVAVFENGFAEHKRQGSSMAMQRAMQIACSEEVTRLERNMPWLAITGAVTPFVGLFGTVWGIIDAFHGLGTAGAATLRAVAPGISEALITTAAGLAVAIPALVGYNQLTAQLRDFAARMDDFGRELLNAIENAAMLAPPAPPAPAPE